MDDCGYFSVCDVAQNVYSKNVFEYRNPRKRRVRGCSSSWSRLMVVYGLYVVKLKLRAVLNLKEANRLLCLYKYFSLLFISLQVFLVFEEI